MKTTPCRGCGKPIVFGLTENGKRIPLDPRPPVYQIVTDGDAGPPDIVRLAQHFDASALRATAMVSHFATCPKASEFSASKKKTERTL